ncbi:phosphinothricin acetyltransferase [Phycisphaerales bacterium]|nr:phosphinothricin acetyltransferase [Phycisphaerales bacterium]
MPPANFTIRPATPADVPAVLPMVAAICAHHEALDPERFAMLPDVVQRYERWLPQRAADPRSIFLVADSTGHSTPPAIVGFIVGSMERNIPIYRLDEFAYLHDLWVQPDFRRQGVATALLNEAIARFRAIGAKQIRLETALANEHARRVCETCGFRAATIDLIREI